MSKNDLKSLAMLAKQRLKDANYSSVQTNTYKKRASNNYFIKNVSSMKKMSPNCEFVIINNKEDLQFLKKVHSILSSNEDILNPIGKLVDKELFEKLNDTQKQQYVLELSEKYNIAKLEFLNSKKVGGVF